MTTRGGCLLVALLVATAAAPAAADEVKRVLIVHSFGSTAPPFTTHSTAFEATLTREMGQRVDLDEVSLDMARYAQPDMEGPFVELMLKRLAKWRPDLVVPVGSPAGRFVAKYRHRLFPKTPVVYTGMDKRTLPSGAFENATFVGEDFRLASLVEDILQLAPDTNNIVVVLGATPLERFWADALRSAFAPFADRVRFTYVNDLTFDQMLELAANLPPRSFILLALLLRDAAGVTHNEDDALQRLRAVSSAPINGLYQHQLGLGIVGGHLYQAELQGEVAARIAIRILRGEPVSSFPPLIVGAQGPRYDWRELQRWNIGEERLPAGSVVEFRRPTTWERYRWWVLAGLGIVLLEAGLIVLLAVNLVRRWRVEGALRDSEERVNLAADSAGAGLWALDVRTGRLWATPRLYELFQLPSTPPLDVERFVTAIHPEDRPQVRRAFESATTNDLNLEFRIVRGDGSQRWIVTRGHLDDRAKRWSGASVDITERKLAENRLRESESRFRTIADSAPVLIWMADADRMCTFVNRAWLEFTGRSVEQEMGNGWTERIHPEDQGPCLDAWAAAFEARQPFVLQYQLLRHDGEYRWISDNGVPRYDSQGIFAGYIGSCLDITERLRAEERFRQVFEAAPNAMIMVSETGRVVLVNAQVEKVFGYRRGEIVGLPIEMLIPDRFRPAHPGHRKDFFADPRARPIEAGRGLFARRKDGSEIPVEIGLNPIRTTEGVFVVASVIDVSERQKAEAVTLELRQELAHISRVATMGELTAAIVHELGQPMAATLANAQAGLRLIAAGKHDIDQLREILADIVANENRAREVIQRLRSMFSKGEVEHSVLVLNDVIHEVVAVLLRDAERRQVALTLELDPGPIRVSGDRIQLQQVLLNLIVNAFDALTGVTGRPRKVIVRARPLDGDRVQVDVADTGPGIPADKLGSIFKPFVSGKVGGMGMGLSISHSIVTDHEGRLWVDNGPEGGAVFHIVLPTVVEAAVTRF